LTSSGWHLCFSTCKREIFEKIEAIEEKATITLIPEETRTTNPYLKYAAIFVLGLGLAGSVVINVSKPNRLRNVAG
jgi:IMP cyclohydrolase